MFAYLQIFLLISLLAVVGVTTVGGNFLRMIATEDATSLIENSSDSVAQGYLNQVWKKYRDVIVPIASDPAKLQANPQVIQFAQDTINYFAGMHLVRVNVYSASGGLLLTDNIAPANKIAGTAASVDKNFVLTRLQHPGDARSQVVHDVPMQNGQTGRFLQTVYVIAPPPGVNMPAEGMIEVLVDITDIWSQLRSLQITGSSIAIGSFIIFLLVISFSTRKAESIIAKQHEANIELAQTAATALAENQDKSQFLTNISHELRTPLNAIIGFSDIIKLELLPKLTERKYDQYINDINSAGVHLLSLINDILDYSKAEAGKLILEVTEVDVTKMVQNCMRLVAPRAESGEVTLVDEMPKEHIIMVLDGKKLKQILLNLLSNAVKFTPSGGSVSVTAWTSMVEDVVTFVVADSGIGIAPKDISRAMSPFGQVDNTLKRKYEGTGLGLPLTKKFVELMGGRFNIESELGKGTKVIFSLPRETKQRDDVIVKQASE